jgi:hypothetical protein
MAAHLLFVAVLVVHISWSHCFVRHGGVSTTATPWSPRFRTVTLKPFSSPSLRLVTYDNISDTMERIESGMTKPVDIQDIMKDMTDEDQEIYRNTLHELLLSWRRTHKSLESLYKTQGSLLREASKPGFNNWPGAESALNDMHHIAVQLKEQAEELEKLHDILLPSVPPPHGVSWTEYLAMLLTLYKDPAERQVMEQVLLDINSDNHLTLTDDVDSGHGMKRTPLASTLVSQLYEHQDEITMTHVETARATIKERELQLDNRQAAIAAVQCELELAQSIDKHLCSDDRLALYLPVDRWSRCRPVTRSDWLRAVAILDGTATTTTSNLDCAAHNGASLPPKKTLFVRDNKHAWPSAMLGGFVLRGTNVCETPAALLAAFEEASIEPIESAKTTLVYVPDLTSSDSSEHILLVVPRDQSPRRFVAAAMGSTLVALITAVHFATGVYDSSGGSYLLDMINGALAWAKTAPWDLLRHPVQSLGVTAGLQDVLWNGGVARWIETTSFSCLDIMIPLLVIAVARHAGHWTVAARDGFEMAWPPFSVPSFPLPSLAVQTRLKSSPPSLASLFDFGAVASLCGILTSIMFLVAGLQVYATPDVVAAYPQIELTLLKQSMLGAGIVEHLTDNANLNVLLRHPDEPGTATFLRVHPWVIAGYVGLLTQTLELLPLGATDGGRLSLALFGRPGHAIVHSIVAVGLCVITFIEPDAFVLIWSYAAYCVIQTQPEIPCRDEVSKLDVGRGMLALGLWIFALLVLTPMP